MDRRVPTTRWAAAIRCARRIALDFLPTAASADCGSLGDMKTFEDVVSGARAVVRIDEDEHHLAFLNSSPLRPGHTIVVTKRVVPYVFDLDAEAHARLWEFARRIAVRIRERLLCERVCVGVIGWQVRHAHVHLVPTNADGEFPPLPGTAVTAEELRAVASRLRASPP
jgi:histidine triad (HIT) family protein